MPAILPSGWYRSVITSYSIHYTKLYDFFLEKCVCADGYHRSRRGKSLERVGAYLAVEATEQRYDLDTERYQPLGKIAGMLLGEYFGRRHHRYLITGFDGAGSSGCGHHGLAGTDVTLEQALHRHRLSQVLPELTDDTPLRGRELERQMRQQCIE